MNEECDIVEFENRCTAVSIMDRLAKDDAFLKERGNEGFLLVKMIDKGRDLTGEYVTCFIMKNVMVSSLKTK